MIATVDFTGDAVVRLEVSRQDRDRLKQVFYNLRDGVAWDANMDANVRAQAANLFSSLYDVFDLEGNYGE